MDSIFNKPLDEEVKTLNGNIASLDNDLTTLSSKALQRAIYNISPGTANLFGLSANSTYLIFTTSNVSKGVWIVQTGLSNGTVTNIVQASGVTVQMAGATSLILQYSNSTSYGLGLGVVLLGTT